MTLACESRGPAPPRRYIVTQYSGPDLLGGYRSCRSESEPERNGENEITHHAVLPHALKRQDDLVFGPSQHLAVWRQRPKHSRGQPARPSDLITILCPLSRLCLRLRRRLPDGQDRTLDLGLDRGIFIDGHVV